MGFDKTLKIGTRKSRLAIAQAQQVQEALRVHHPDWKIELVPIITTGDRLADATVTSIEGKGIFLKELEDALLHKEIDCAVHSMKDVPTELPPELTMAIMLKRDDPHDGLVASCSLSDLPPGSRIGTSSSRRKSQLLAVRPDLEISQVRGNVDTRVRKWRDGQYDALVLAVAGLKRIGLAHLIFQILPFDIILPAAGQGAIGVEVRKEDRSLLENLIHLDDPETHIAVSAERTFLAAVGGGCRLPIGVCGAVSGSELQLSGRITREKNGVLVGGTASGSIDESRLVAERLAKQLLTGT